MKSFESQSQSEELEEMELDFRESKFKVKKINKMDSPKFIDLKFHTGSINSIAFANNSKYYLVSGGADKTVMIWKILLNEANFSSQKSRMLTSLSDITDIVISKNDEYIFTACVDNFIYVYKSNFIQNQYTTISNINIHSNIITSIHLDPAQAFYSQSIKFASYSDEGRLILAELSIAEMKANITRDFTEIINKKNKINSIQKKIG